MAYYYDHIERQWKPKQQEPEWRRVQCRGGAYSIPLRRIYRKTILEELFKEIEWYKGGPTVTYAMLLARALVQADEELMREFGERVVQVTEGVTGMAA